MGRLNAPREIAYDFRVIEKDGWVWLFDNSSRTYPCSATAHIYCAPLYAVDAGDDWDGLYPDSGLWRAADIDTENAPRVPVECPFDMDRQEAWDTATAEAQAYCLI